MRSAIPTDAKGMSPVTEVYLHEQKERMRREIRDRKYSRLESIHQLQCNMHARASAPPPFTSAPPPWTTATPPATSPVVTTAPVINLVSSESDSDFHDAVPASNTPVAVPVARPITTGYTDNPYNPAAPNPPLSQTLRDLFVSVMRNGDHIGLGEPCPHKACPLCTGAPMTQRYQLAKRLAQLDRFLFGV